ncbi:hypothetical protein PIB30_083399 [Stylosanthes scabra]|uniref:SCP domain-containing protein n=1 Tax=Stylosanthes scabra TaxID=79078 RepID=A0ABU6VRZ6_9FABA|nr:hypothetical protein [Stylosanthes scabra]
MKRFLKIWILAMSFVNVIPLFLWAQNSPKDYLRAHNDARTEVCVNPLKWDKQLELHASKFVKKRAANCKNELINISLGGMYGQNIVYTPKSQTGAEAVAAWVNQKHNYDYKSNSCIDGTIKCRCYTEVVWDTTTLVGCARVKCRNYEGTLTTCLYYPNGGDFNQRRPYKIH